MSETTSKKFADPYRIFFPIGFFLGAIGVLSWLLFSVRQNGSYPGLYHSDTMILGFFLSIAMGFLMTAVPRFTGSFAATREEILIPAFLFLQIPWMMMWRPQWISLIALLQMILLIRFGIRRLRQGSSAPFPPFILVGFGLFCALLGSAIKVAGLFFPLSQNPNSWARLLLYEGFPLGLLLGVGTRLLPFFIGALPPQTAHPFQIGVKPHQERRFFLGLGLLLMSSFLVEQFYLPLLGQTLRYLLVSALLILRWPLFRLPPKSAMAVGIWLSAWFLLIGGWPGIVWPAYQIHFKHLIFIGVISIMILSVATRVVVSHGGHPKILEVSSPALIGGLSLTTISLGLRLFAPVSPNYFLFLGIAATCWTGGILIWLLGFFPKIIRRKV